MCYYCTKCNINWARLATETDDERDETYEFCPGCKSDMDLVDGRPGPQYISTINGIIDVQTREPLFTPAAVIEYKQPEKKPFDPETFQKAMAEREAAEDRKLEKYIEMCSTVGHKEAYNYFITH